MRLVGSVRPAAFTTSGVSRAEATAMAAMLILFICLFPPECGSGRHSTIGKPAKG
jgi:hypothetical protein